MGNCCQGKELEQEFSQLNNIRTLNEEVGDSKCFEHTEFDANLQDTVFFEGSSHLGCSTKFGTQNPNTDKVNNDFLDLKQKYEMLTDYISKSSDVQNHEFNGSEHNDIDMQVDNEVKESSKKMNTLQLSLTVLSSNSSFFTHGMEININNKGLDENYPFVMSQEAAKQ